MPASTRLPDSGLRCADRFGWGWWRALTEVMGDHGRATALRLAGIADQPPPSDLVRGVDFSVFAACNAAFTELYGERGGRDLALRAGRAWFALTLAEFGALRGAAHPAFRALPLDERLRLGLGALADIMGGFSDQTVRVEAAPTAWHWHTDASPFSTGLNAARPLCHPWTGALQEAGRWLSNGRVYTVRETACRAAGAPECVFVVSRQPLG